MTGAVEVLSWTRVGQTSAPIKTLDWWKRANDVAGIFSDSEHRFVKPSVKIWFLNETCIFGVDDTGAPFVSLDVKRNSQ